MGWDDAASELQAVVRGSRGQLYTAVVSFQARGATLDFGSGVCSCPVGVNCKHVVAAVLTAAGPARTTPDSVPHPGWEQSLTLLLEPTRPGSARETDATGLGIELSLSGARAAPPRSLGAPAGLMLSARVVRPGRSGWVGGGLTWSKLASPYSVGQYQPAHVRLLRELYALHRSATDPSGYHYSSYQQDKTIDLASVEGRQLWPMLDEAAAIGVPVVHARKRFGVVEPYGHGELCLDARAGQAEGSLVISPLLRIEDTSVIGPSLVNGVEVVPVRFIGTQGHGVVYVRAAEAGAGADPAQWPIRLARLAAPVPAPLQTMALAGQCLAVPADQLGRFRERFYPRLRNLAPVVSRDGSFTPPTISE
ncbi:MAG: SWIM zinc finger family protein, partial [Actinomycetes bacterium]